VSQGLIICFHVRAFRREALDRIMPDLCVNSNILEHIKILRAMITYVSQLRLPQFYRIVLNSCSITEKAARNFHGTSAVFDDDEDPEQRMTLKEIERIKRQERSELILG